jgi:hypothetical protein
MTQSARDPNKAQKSNDKKQINRQRNILLTNLENKIVFMLKKIETKEQER